AEQRRQPIGLRAERIELRPEPIDFRALLPVAVLLLPLESSGRDAEPLQFRRDIVPLGPEAFALGQGRRELRLAGPGQARVRMGLRAERIQLGPEPIERGAVLLDPFLPLPLELRDRRAEPPQFRRDVVPLGSEAVALGQGRCVLRLAVAGQDRVPIGLGSGGPPSGPPPPLPPPGRIFAGPGVVSPPPQRAPPPLGPCAQAAAPAPRPPRLGAKSLALAPEPFDLGAQRVPLRDHRPDFGRRDPAQDLDDPVQVDLVTIALGLEAILLGLEAIALGLEAILLDLEAIALGAEF